MQITYLWCCRYHSCILFLTTSCRTQVRSGLRGDRDAAAAACGARHAAGRGLRAPDRVPVPAARPPAGVRASLVTGQRSSGAYHALDSLPRGQCLDNRDWSYG